MASTTSELRGKKQSLSLNPAQTPAGLILGLKRQSCRRPETFHRPDYGTFLPARDFSDSIWNSGTKREPSALLARVEVIKVPTSRTGIVVIRGAEPRH